MSGPGPCRMWGAITMKMISSTNTTSTSGVTLIVDRIGGISPSRMSCLRRLEENVDELGRGLIHLDLEALEQPREVVEGDDGRNRYEDAQRGRDQGLGDAARDRGHPAGARRRDASKGVDDADHRAEEADERRRGPDAGQHPETAPHLDHRLDLR